MTAEVTALLPKERPRYLMGRRPAEQIADYVARGIDMMDCVLPTRAARHACLYTSEGRVLIKNARYIEDQRPIDPRCACAVCKRYTRAYLRHLFAAGEITGAILATHHNVHFYLDIMRNPRGYQFWTTCTFRNRVARALCGGPSLKRTARDTGKNVRGRGQPATSRVSAGESSGKGSGNSPARGWYSLLPVRAAGRGCSNGPNQEENSERHEQFGT